MKPRLYSSDKFYWHQPATTRDFLILAVFIVVMTFQPYFLYAEINFFEMGLYLPGIDTVIKGGVPFRDVIHLRGVLELYFPALFMSILGNNIAVLSLYFYVGTIVTMVAWLAVAGQLYITRYLLYLFTLVFVARTFPRVAFMNWGGFRFAFGAMAVLCMIYFFKRGKKVWMLWAGIMTAASALTSIEMGFCSVAGIGGALMFSYIFSLQDRKGLWKAFWFWILGIMCLIVPFAVYLAVHGALGLYLENVYTIVTQMQKVIPPDLYEGPSPRNIVQGFTALVTPTHKNFRHMTPTYLYIFLAIYFVIRARKKQLTIDDAKLVGVGVYGVMIYYLSFRWIWGSQFELALQPQKVLLFYLLEVVYLTLLALKHDLRQKLFQISGQFFTKAKLYGVYFLLVSLFMSSVGYAIDRYRKRFFVFQWAYRTLRGEDRSSLIPMNGQPSERLHLPRIKFVTVPDWQANDCNLLVKFIEANTKPDETVFMFPELAGYSYIIDRPFVGRFPMVTFSWFNDEWHREFVKELKNNPPRFAIVDKDPGESFSEVYFKAPGSTNREKYDEVARFIEENYQVIDETPSLWICKNKNSPR